MNLFEYVSLMKEKGSVVAIIGVALLALFLLVIILKMLGGMRRGTWRQLIRTGMTVLAAVASYIFGVCVSNSIIGSTNIKAIEDFIQTVDGYAPGVGDVLNKILLSFDPEMYESVILLPATIILIPLLTTVIFLLINLVLKIVRAIIIKIFRFKKAKNNSQRLGGALLSAVEAITWIIMVTLPLSAALSLVDAAYNEAFKSEDADTSSISETYEEYLAPFTKNPAVCFINDLGGGAMADGIATVKLDNEKTNMRKEVVSVAHIIIIDANALKGADFTALNENEKAALSSILDTLAESPYMSRVLVSVIKTVPSIYESGLIPLDFGEDFRAVTDSVMAFLEAVNRESLGDDLSTIKDFYFGFCDSGILTAVTEGEDLMQFISNDYKNEKHILNIINTLSGNVKTKGIVDGMYNLVLNIAFSGALDSGDGESSEEGTLDINIEDVKVGLNNIVSVNKSDYETEEEYKEALSTTIDTTIYDTIGVDLDDEVVDNISDYVDENYAEQLEDLTDEEFNELIFEVIDIYNSYLNGEDVNPDDIENILGGGDH